jgi:hypothetical protein
VRPWPGRSVLGEVKPAGRRFVLGAFMLPLGHTPGRLVGRELILSGI